MVSNFLYNLTLIEFFPFHFLVKDLRTQVPLVCFRSKDGLYEWHDLSSPQLPQVQMASLNNVPIATWHLWLGHPHAKVLKIILNGISLPVSQLDNLNFSNSWFSNKAHQQAFARFTLSSSKLLQMIFSDLWDHLWFFQSITNYIIAYLSIKWYLLLVSNNVCRVRHY